MEKLGINLGLLLVQIFNFAIIFVVLRAWVFKPLMNMLDKRRETVAQSLEDARIASEARANAETEANQIIEEARRKASEVVSEASTRADAAAREIRTAAEAELANERTALVAEMEQERVRMLGELRSQVVALSISAAERLIGESLIKDTTTQHALLQEFFSGVKGGKVTLLEGKTGLAGSRAEVTTAMTLTDDEKATIKKDLAARVGSDVEIEWLVDPKILGGVIIRVGDELMDGSVVGQLVEMKSTLER
ncbi:MAG: F0F1 ATP synthase subunit B [Anaerolineae bacterium]|nr:F0F1 ATP synthase subunit B [Anaerolineae bacterium]